MLQSIAAQVRDFAETYSAKDRTKRAEADIEHNGKRFKAVKGAPQVIVDLCAPAGDEHAAIGKTVDEEAAKGYRTLGVARTDDSGTWRFLGLLPLFDPPHFKK
jgi:H+-transporting ATPase